MTTTPQPAVRPFVPADQFPLSRPYGAIESTPEPPSPARPFGLTLAVPPASVATVDPAEIGYDEDTQVGVIRENGKWVSLAKHTDGPTNTVTDGGDGQRDNRDSDNDHRED